MNNVIISGRLTADPELKTTPNGVSVCTFIVAVDRAARMIQRIFLLLWRGDRQRSLWRNTCPKAGKLLS